MIADSNSRSPIEWLSAADSSVVGLLGYGFAKRHGLVAVCESEGVVEVVCVEPPEVEIYAELRRKFSGQLRVNTISQKGFSKTN